MEFTETFNSRAKKAAKKRSAPSPYRVCPECGRDLLKAKDYHRKHGRCKLCQDNSRPSCGCGCGAHAEKDYQIYAPDIPSRGRDVGTYYLTQGHADKANGLNRRQLDRWKNEATN